MLRVTGDIVNNGTKGLSPCPIRMGTGTFTIAAKGLVAAGSSIATMPQTGDLTVLWEIGADGISGANLISHPNISSSARFTAESDFTIAAPMALGKVFTFDTGDGYTVTLGDGDGNGWFVRGGRMEISGAGKVVCNCVSTNVYNNYDAYSGEVRVLSGAALTFNFTDAAAAPVLAVAGGKSAKASGAVTVGISGDASAKKVPYALTTCGGFGSATVTLAAGSPDWAKLSVDGNGNLVLERKKTGLVLIVR